MKVKLLKDFPHPSPSLQGKPLCCLACFGKFTLCPTHIPAPLLRAPLVTSGKKGTAAHCKDGAARTHLQHGGSLGNGRFYLRTPLGTGTERGAVIPGLRLLAEFSWQRKWGTLLRTAVMHFIGLSAQQHGGFRCWLLNEKSLMLQKDDDFCKTTFTSYKPWAEKYSGLLLCTDTKILNRSDWKETTYSHELSWSNIHLSSPI